MPHRKRTIIKTPFPTPEEVRKAMGVSKTRFKFLKKIMADVLDKEAKTRS